ncbi:MAG TPA: hypothetical protein VFA02_06495 [Pseudacidobacterium sp.]|nr:hypothetical protein [Pseudacidobacterium sp.]
MSAASARAWLGIGFGVSLLPPLLEHIGLLTFTGNSIEHFDLEPAI